MSMAQTDQSLVLELERSFPAPRERVFRRWTDPGTLARWFAPNGYVTVSASVDPRPGGSWSLIFRSREGHEYEERGEYLTIDSPTRLELTLAQVDGDRVTLESTVTVDFEDVGTPDRPRTRMRFVQRGYRSVGHRDANAEGWGGCFDSLHREVVDRPADEREIRDLFAAWFDASERKDLDASMAPIAEDVVSYEHETPQEYHGRAAVREVCAAGFEYQTGDFRWDVPDLEVRVAGDLAVTWGLNRMRSVAPDGTAREQWSRGTRVFERRDGRWQMTHQHVSFPVDSEGRASMDR